MENEKYNIFICFRGKSESGLLAQQIYTTLKYYKNNNDQSIFVPFFAPRCVKKGADFYEEEKKALSQIKIMILVLTKGFFANCTEDDDQVYFEITTALNRGDVQFVTVFMNSYSIHSDPDIGKVFSVEQITTIRHVNNVNFFSIYDFDPEKELIPVLETLISDQKNSQLFETLERIQIQHGFNDGIKNLIIKALLGDRENRRTAQTTILQSPRPYRNQFLKCMLELLSFPNEVVRGEAYYCLGELSHDSDVKVDEPFLCKGLSDESDFVRACCSNVLRNYIPLEEETINILKNELVRIGMIELCEDISVYSKKLKYYAIKTINEDELWKTNHT